MVLGDWSILILQWDKRVSWMWRKYRTELFICLFLSMFSAAQAEAVRASIYDFFPMGDAENLESDRPGMFYEIVKAILEESELDYKIYVEPIGRVFERMRRNNSDVLIGLPTPNAQLSVPIHCNQVVVVANSDRIKSINDLKGARIGFVSDGLFSRLYGKKFGTLNEFSPSDTGLFHMLHAERIEGFMITKNVINAYRYAPPLNVKLPYDWDKDLHYALTISASQVYLQFPQGSQLNENQIQRLTSVAEALNEQGVFGEIMNRYGTEQMRMCVGQ